MEVIGPFLKVKKWLERNFAYGKQKLISSLQYRFAFFSSYLSMMIQPFILFFIWKEIYAHGSDFHGFTFSQMVTYIFVSQSINGLFGFQTSTERQVTAKIQSGEISNDLLRPTNFCAARFFETMSLTVIQSLFSLVFFSVCYLFLPISLPPSFLTLLFFILSLIGSILILFLISLCVGFIGFYTLNISGIIYGRKAVIDLLSGALIPYDFLPGWAKRVSDFLPFKDIIYSPTMIYMGRYQSQEMVTIVQRQVFWIFCLTLLVWFIYRLAIRRVVVHGG